MAEEVGGQHVNAVLGLTLLLPATVRRVAVVAVGVRWRTCCKQHRQTRYRLLISLIAFFLRRRKLDYSASA